MRIKQLTYRGKEYTQPSKIDEILSNKFEWLNDAEIENAIITIEGNRLIWETGVWYYGECYADVWKDGIFKYGTFHENGIWQNGEFVNGVFKGVWENGEKKGGEFDLLENKVFTFSQYLKK